MTAPDLRGQRAFVSAAGAGIGRAIARALHQAGAQVLACDIDATGLTDLAEDCPGITTTTADAGDEATIETIFTQMDRDLGGIDILINTVGISGPTAIIEDTTLADWSETMRVNLTGHFLACRAATPRMKAQGGGLIVNISSGAARNGLPMRTPYVVSKGALLSLTMNLARELGPSGIRVNAILPGAVAGPRLDRVFREKAEALGQDVDSYTADKLRYISLRSTVTPEDVAGAVLYFASSAGARISGQMLGVDGHMEWAE